MLVVKVDTDAQWASPLPFYCSAYQTFLFDNLRESMRVGKRRDPIASLYSHIAGCDVCRFTI